MAKKMNVRRFLIHAPARFVDKILVSKVLMKSPVVRAQGPRAADASQGDDVGIVRAADPRSANLHLVVLDG